jgi:peptidyl-prolyl cis-trans isomerase D
LKTSELVTRDSQVPEIGQMAGPASAAFTMNKGEISGPIGTATAGVVLSVLEKQEPSPGAFAQQKEQIREAVLRRKRGEVFEVFLSNLRQRMEKDGKIQVNSKEMNRIMAAMKEGS